MNLVRRDSHGLFVKSGGRIFRPISADLAYSPSRPPGVSAYAMGEKVRVNIRSQSPYCKVFQPGKVIEFWHDHGHYMRRQGEVTSEECWIPEGTAAIRRFGHV